jgi:hypothetical protein
MIPNVETIKRHQKTVYPDLWPEYVMDTVVHALYRQQPENHPDESYYFAVKEDNPDSGPMGALVYAGSGNVLFQCSGSKQDTAVFRHWFSQHQAALHKWADTDFRGMVVGKLDKFQSPKRLLVYYIIKGTTVYLDVPSIDTLAGIRSKITASALISAPLEGLINITVDRTSSSVVSRDVTGQNIQHVANPFVAFPVVRFEPRNSEDGGEGAPPRLLTSDIHMRFMAFKSNE